MPTLRNATLGVLLATAVALPVYAQRLNSEATGDPTLNLDYLLMVIQPNGKTTMAHADRATAAELMQHAKPMSSAMIVGTSGGKTWTIEDTKMKNGMMMSEWLTREQKLP